MMNKTQNPKTMKLEIYTPTKVVATVPYNAASYSSVMNARQFAQQIVELYEKTNTEAYVMFREKK